MIMEQLIIDSQDRERYLLASIAAKNVHGRQIVLWGDNKELRRVLKTYFELEVKFVVTILKDIINGSSIRDLAEMKGKSGQYYIINWGRTYEAKYHELLAEYGFKEIEDVVHRMPKPIVIENWDFAKGEYNDIYGNYIEGSAGVIKRIVLKGYNNRVHIGKNVTNLRNIEFELCANGEVLIGDNCIFSGDSKFRINGYNGSSKIYIGQNCRFAVSSFELWNHPECSSVVINGLSTFEHNFEAHANTGKKIVIGKDCMFSFNIQLQAGDGHTIFDVNTGKDSNSYSKKNMDQNLIVIGEHVWVSSKAFILHGTNIGNGSIVGGNSTVKGIYPNNCVIAGNPAAKVKENVAWSRDNGATDITRCGKEYAVLTDNRFKPAISGMNVLVVGGTRFMGVRLVEELLRRGNLVTIATRGRAKDSFGMRVDRIKVDITDEQSAENAFKGKYFDIVFDDLAFDSNNVNNLLSNIQCDKYIQLSSIAVYSNRNPNMDETEFDPCSLTPDIKKTEMSYTSTQYGFGKKLAEAFAYHKFGNVKKVSVRIPYVTRTDRLYYYCKHVIKHLPMNISDTNRGFVVVRETEVAVFLPWIAAQEFTGPINLASEGIVTIQMILDYIESKTGERAIIDINNGSESPFNEKTFSLNINKVRALGYHTSNVSDWFWGLMDEYIARAIRERDNEEKGTKNMNIDDFSVCSVDRTRCTGCGACMNVCPKGAITMRADEEGFTMPEVIKDRCIACGLCKKICPTFDKTTLLKDNIACYAMMASDEVRKVSSSGGAFTLLAEKVLGQGGAVCGVAWTDDYQAKHIFISNSDELSALRGSKYVQSDTNTTYQETKRRLQEGQLVLYTGLPCQIDGLLHYLQKDYDNLITVDLLCRGVASNELFKKFANENYKNVRLNNINFKEKSPLGWGATTSYELSDGTIEKTNIHNSIWMCAYLANIMDRQSCYTCKFNAVKRVGDISIGDFWGIEKFNQTYNDRKGTSIVITSTKKGDELVKSVQKQCKLLEEVPVNHGAPFNSALSQHVKMTPNRKRFFEENKKMPVPAALDRVIYGEKYSVGIVGWWYNLNYGGVLTYFALNRSIQSMGYSVLMVRRSSSEPTMPNDDTIPMRFAKKHYNISRLYTKRDMHWLNYSCHAFVSGSDQLWNPHLQEYSGPEYFLDFVNHHNLKVSYASSFGNMESISDDFNKRYQPYLKRFDAISVREDYAVGICKDNFDIEARQVCDPVFLCNPDIYKEIAKEATIQLPDKYLLNFLLDPNAEKVSEYKSIQQQLGLERSVNFTDLQDVTKRIEQFVGEPVFGNAEIEDFIKAYVYADFVITDSFHGTCLAVIFNKPFISIANKARGEKRFISLLKWLGLSDRLVHDVSTISSRTDLLQPIDFTDINKRILESRESAYKWLKDILGKMV